MDSPEEQSERQRLAGIAGMWFVFTLSAAVVTWLAVVLDVADAGASELTDPNSALFETASATSTTGLSMLADSSTADAWLQWWRSILQWLGALGVILFAVLVAEPSGDHESLVGGEWGDAGGDGHRETIKRVGNIPSTQTAACIGALIVVGEPVWRALNHALTAAATGGFTITKDSAASSGSAAQSVLVVTMLISAVSFGTLWDIGHRTGAPIWKRTQVRWGVAMTTIGICFALVVSNGLALVDVAFNSISASTTAGFVAGTGPPSVGAVGAIAMVTMLIGGAAGSTAGGIKIARVVWLAKAVMRWIPGKTESTTKRPTCGTATRSHRLTPGSGRSALRRSPRPGSWHSPWARSHSPGSR